MRNAIKKVFAIFDARDVFCLIGFVLFFAGMAHFNLYIACIATGGVILTKGLIKWG